MIGTIHTLALGSIIVGVEQFELSSPGCCWSNPTKKEPALSSSSLSTIPSSLSSFFLSKMKCDCLIGDMEPRRGKERVGRECRLTILKIHFANVENTFCKCWKYILKMLKRHFANLENTFYKCWKHILQMLKIHFANVENTFSKCWKYILQMLKIHFANVETTFSKIILGKNQVGFFVICS